MRTCLFLLTVVALLSTARAEACVTQGLPEPGFCGWLRSEGTVVLARVERVSAEPVDLGGGDPVFQRTLHLRVLQTLRGSAPEWFRMDAGWFFREELALAEPEDGVPRILRIRSPVTPEDGPEPQLSADWYFIDDLRDLPVHVDRMVEAVQLLQRQASLAEEREWLVRCAVRRVTRANALAALLATDVHGAREDGRPTVPLTLEQRRALLDGFRQEPSTDDGFLEALQLGRGVAHPAFDRVAVGVMELLLFGTDGDLAPEAPQALYLLMERLGVPDLESRWGAVQAALDAWDGEVPASLDAGAGDDPASASAPVNANPYMLEDPAREAAKAAEDAAAQQVLRALWDALRSAGHLVPAPRVPHA